MATQETTKVQFVYPLSAVIWSQVKYHVSDKYSYPELKDVVPVYAIEDGYFNFEKGSPDSFAGGLTSLKKDRIWQYTGIKFSDEFINKATKKNPGLEEIGIDKLEPKKFIEVRVNKGDQIGTNILNPMGDHESLFGLKLYSKIQDGSGWNELDPMPALDTFTKEGLTYFKGTDQLKKEMGAKSVEVKPPTKPVSPPAPTTEMTAAPYPGPIVTPPPSGMTISKGGLVAGLLLAATAGALVGAAIAMSGKKKKKS